MKEHRSPIRIQTAQTQDCLMDYIRFGRGEKTFVILPGLSVQSVLAFSEAIASMYQAFTEDYTVYLFDRRKDPPAGYTIHDMAGDTAGAMRTLGLKDACVYGASQGGMIAMDLAIDYPDLVHKLVLASTTARVDKERMGVIDSWIALAKAGKAEDLYMAFGEAVYPPDVFERVRDSFPQMARTVTVQELDRFIILADAVRGYDVVDALKKIHCPAFVVGSRDDKIFGESAPCQIADALPGSELCLYDGYGHAVYDTAPDFAERMLKFLRHGE